MKVRCKDAVLYHICLLAGYAFIVIIEGAAVAGKGAVVYDVYALGAYPEAHFIGKDGGTLAVEIGLEGVTHGFVEKDSGGTCAHNYGHFAALGTDGLKAGVDAGDHIGRYFLRQGL